MNHEHKQPQQQQDSKKHQQHQQQMKEKMNADALVPVQEFDPMGKRVYHPAIGKRALWGALTGGLIIGFLFWMVASGTWPVKGLGQLSSANYGAAAFMGFVIGSALGALAGSLSGLKHMLRSQPS